MLARSLTYLPCGRVTWFHTGAFLDRPNIAQHYLAEYYASDLQAAHLEDAVLPLGLSAEEEREACRALKGRVLRQEVYTEDATPQSVHPYAVTEHRYALGTVQRQG